MDYSAEQLKLMLNARLKLDRGTQQEHPGQSKEEGGNNEQTQVPLEILRGRGTEVLCLRVCARVSVALYLSMFVWSTLSENVSTFETCSNFLVL